MTSMARKSEVCARVCNQVRAKKVDYRGAIISCCLKITELLNLRSQYDFKKPKTTSMARKTEVCARVSNQGRANKMNYRGAIISCCPKIAELLNLRIQYDSKKPKMTSMARTSEVCARVCNQVRANKMDYRGAIISCCPNRPFFSWGQQTYQREKVQGPARGFDVVVVYRNRI